jgi:exosortase
MPAAQVAVGPPWRIQFDRAAQIKAGLIAAAYLALFFPILRSLAERWVKDPDWSHGILIPFFSIFLAWQRWEDLRRVPIRLAWLGLPILLVSILLFMFSQTPWGVTVLGGVAAYLVWGALLGVLVLMIGLPAMRYAWLPWAYLLFAIPLPRSIYFKLTDPLRQLAATAATAILMRLPDLHVERLGSVIEYDYDGKSGQIGVADACSGMRSTITLCALGVAVACAAERAWWQRLILVLACVPIAVFCNLIRVITTCLLHIYVGPKYAEGTYHTMLGLAVLVLALALFCGLGWVLNNLTVTVPADDEETAEPAGAGGSGA